MPDPDPYAPLNGAAITGRLCSGRQKRKRRSLREWQAFIHAEPSTEGIGAGSGDSTIGDTHDSSRCLIEGVPSSQTPRQQTDTLLTVEEFITHMLRKSGAAAPSLGRNEGGLDGIAEAVLSAQRLPMFRIGDGDPTTTKYTPSPITQLSNLHRALRYDDSHYESTPAPEQTSHHETSYRMEPATPKELLHWTEAKSSSGMTLGGREEKVIDYGLILSTVWGDVWGDTYKYLALMAVSFMTAASRQPLGFSVLHAVPDPHMEISQLTVYMKREASQNRMVEFGLQHLRGEGQDLLDVFFRDEIAPFFYVMAAECMLPEKAVYLNTRRICAAGFQKRVDDLGPGTINERLRAARKVLLRHGMRDKKGKIIYF